MNLKEITLEELELHSYFYEEGISCLLHTILFVRAPGSVRPKVNKTKYYFFFLSFDLFKLNFYYLGCTL